MQDLVERVEPSNELGQVDSWSCGLWVIKWNEQDVRESARNDRPMLVTIQMAATRINAFIDQVKKKAKSPAEGQTIGKSRTAEEERAQPSRARGGAINRQPFPPALCDDKTYMYAYSIYVYIYIYMCM